MLALAALSAVLLLASAAPAFAAQGFTVNVAVPPTVNVGEPTRIFVIFTAANMFIPLDEVTVESIQVATPAGIVELDPAGLVEIDTGWCYIDFAPTETGHYSIIVVASYGGTTSVGAAAFSTTATSKLSSQLGSFREELLVYLDKQFIRTRDVLGSAIGETSAKLSAQISALDEKADAIIASIESVVETMTAGFGSVVESIDALNDAVTSGFEETAAAITDTIASSTDAIKGSLSSSTQAIVGTIQNSNNAIVGTVETVEAALDAFAQDFSSLVMPLAVGIALAVLFAAIAGIKQVLG